MLILKGIAKEKLLIHTYVKIEWWLGLSSTKMTQKNHVKVLMYLKNSPYDSSAIIQII